MTFFLLWEPSYGDTPETGLVYAGNTAKQAAVAYLSEDYAKAPRQEEPRLLHARRITDGLEWIVRLEPVRIVNWKGDTMLVPPGAAPSAPAPTSADPSAPT